MADELLDTGVNCGTGFAKPLLQRALNLLNNQGKAGYADLEVDGVYGSETLRALKPIWPNAGKKARKFWCEFSILCKDNATLKSVSVIQSRNSFSMVGLPIGLLYDFLSIQTFKDSFHNHTAVHSIFRMHSSYDQ